MLVVLTSGCAHRHGDPRPSEAELRGWLYRDDEGLQVLTVGAQLTQRLPWGDTATLDAVLDAIDLDPVDAISGASTSHDDTPGLQEQRYEIAPGWLFALGDAKAPVELGLRGRVSSEPDYVSWSTELSTIAELFQRNTAIGGFVGVGHDTIDPSSTPADDASRWPDTHDRVYGGLSIRQLLSRRVDLAGGLALAYQTGALESPYRRAQTFVGQGFFARWEPLGERHPGERTRAVGFVSSAIYLGFGAALHLRVTGYADSWDVLALAPELALDLELGRFGLLIAGYRFSAQTRASFHQPTYRASDELRTGDRRLGTLDEHMTGLELRWTVLGAPLAKGSLDLALGWQLSYLTYRDVLPERAVTAHQGTLGLLVRY